MRFPRLSASSQIPLFVIAFLLGATAGSIVTALAEDKGRGSVPALAPSESAANAPARAVISGTFAPVVEKAIPAVVSITASRVVRMPQQLPFPFFFGPDARDFFGMPDPRGPGDEKQPGRRQQGLGSGVIVTKDGYLLTNHHVIDGASEIEILLGNDREFKAKVVGSDPGTDIAVLKIDAKELPVLPFGNSNNVRVGDIVLAIGNPFGVGQTVTMGIVGATARGNLNIEDYEDFVQTDAAINPGNSGGALIDVTGKLIGINTAIVSGSGRGNQGVGFAIPVNMVHGIMTQLIETGKVSRGFIGVSIQGLDASMAKAFKAPDTTGALISGVEPGTPGAKAGLKPGDIIRSLDGNPVRDPRTLRLAVASAKPGTKINLKIWRDGSEQTIPVTLEELRAENQTAQAQPASRSALNGVNVEALTPAIAQQLGVGPQTQGVVVTSVAPDSQAYQAGLRRGDVIEEIGQSPVRSAGAFRDAVAKAGAGPVLLLVNRRGNTLFVAIESNQ